MTGSLTITLVAKPYPITVIRLARWSWSAKQGNRMAWGHSEAEAIENLVKKPMVIK